MLNIKLISRVLGTLLLFETFLLMVAFACGLYYHETDYFSFSIPIVISVIIAFLLKWYGKDAVNRMGRRDGYLIVSLSWLMFSVVGTLPFLIGGYETRIAAAFFESMSGFSTTGASVLNNIDSLPHSILFWRSLTHWFGGLGIVFFTIAVLPQMGLGDLKLFSAEATGLKTGKLHPRVKTTARWLWSIYLLLTISCTGALYLCGMNLFDAINHGLSTVSTGGFSTHQASLAFFDSALIEYVITLFMFLGGFNFTLLYLFFIKRRWRDVFRDGELRCYLAIVGFVTFYTTCVLFFFDNYEIEKAFRLSVFHTVSLQTTTGFTTSDFMMWHTSSWMLLFFVSMCGACAGSTSGGIKCVRIFTSYKLLINEFKHILHPRAVIPIRINQTSLSYTVGQSIFAYLVAFFVLVFLGTTMMVCMDVPLLDSVSLSIASFCNVGPSIGWLVGPLDSWSVLSDGVLWVNSFLMLAGRLEIFSLLLPFVPAFWRDN